VKGVSVLGELDPAGFFLGLSLLVNVRLVGGGLTRGSFEVTLALKTDILKVLFLSLCWIVGVLGSHDKSIDSPAEVGGVRHYPRKLGCRMAMAYNVVEIEIDIYLLIK